MVERGEVQGIVLRGYSSLPEAAYVLFGIHDPLRMKAWLSALLHDREITSAIQPRTLGAPEHSRCVNVAFTHDGLKALGLPPTTLDWFSREFQEGLSNKTRARMLGDQGDSDSSRWEWGGPTTPPVHLLLLLFARSGHALEQDLVRHREKAEQAGLTFIKDLRGTTLTGRKEHFGFRDGIAQPVLKNVSDDSPGSGGLVDPGEILLGNVNGYNLIPPGPQLRGQRIDVNGSYLVFRQLEQDVVGFWNFVSQAATSLPRGATPEWLAAKMVGRWPSGAPVVMTPDHDDPTLGDDDSFGYAAGDANGVRCPFGSHIRRSNPRDWGPGDDATEGAKNASVHRIMRRGRPYGSPLVPDMSTDKIVRQARALAASGDTRERRGRGLHFLCFNSDIRRQFEFVQQTWINNPKFAGLQADEDPLIGDQLPTRLFDAPATFTVQSDPVRKRVTGLQRFVHVRGGAYFFMPGFIGLKALAG